MFLTKRKILKSLLVISLFASSYFCGEAKAFDYNRVLKYSFSSEHSFESIINNYSVSVTYKTNNDHRLDVVKLLIENSSYFIFMDLDSKGIDYRGCSHKHNINLFEVSQSFINNRSIFPKSRYYPHGDVIFAFWEPVSNDNDVIVISVSDSDSFFSKLVVHEIAHYWYNRLNLSKIVDMTHEEYAMYIEKEFIKANEE